MRNECGNMDQYMDEDDGISCKTAHRGHYTVTSDGTPNRNNRPHVDHRSCEPGYHCPGGQKLVCNDNSAKFQDQDAQPECRNVREGWYTTPIGNGVKTGESPCEPGHRCGGRIRFG